MIKLQKDILNTFSICNQGETARKNKEVFNTVFEMELRIMLLMSSVPELFFSSTRILAFDFINCYAKVFGIALENLHGNNDFMYAEMAGRRSLITEAIKKLVRHGILKVKNNQGYQYKITDYGLEISNGFHSTYAEEYRRVSRLSAKKYSCKNDEELLQEIQYRPIAN